MGRGMTVKSHYGKRRNSGDDTGGGGGQGMGVGGVGVEKFLFVDDRVGFPFFFIALFIAF